MKLTPWFSGDVKPVRPGVYRRRFRHFLFGMQFCRWDGKHWHVGAKRVRTAAIVNAVSWIQLDNVTEWQGVLK